MIFLRFPDESTAMSELRQHGFVQNNEQGEEVVITASHQWAIDCIGTITRGGEYDPETGDVIVAPEVLDGWHVNFAGELPDGWDEFVVTPANPHRVFA
jgi:hypothetical protein